VTRTRERGFALLIVLWSMVLLALMITTLLANGRTAMTLAGNIRDAAAARARADGAINEALFHALANGPQHWVPDGSWHDLPGGVRVRVATLGGLVNPNLASTNLLAGLLQACGADEAQANRLAAAIIDWRSPPLTQAAEDARAQAYRRAGLHFSPPGTPFSDLAELGDVLGMPPALLQTMLPYMSLYQTDDPDPALASPLVRRALQLGHDPGALHNGFQGSFPTVEIEAQAARPGRAMVRRQGVFSLAGADGPHPYGVMLLTGG
jgi:general secretion pathway protein K